MMVLDIGGGLSLRKHILVMGEALAQTVKAHSSTISGDIVVSPECWELIKVTLRPFDIHCFAELKTYLQDVCEGKEIEESPDAIFITAINAASAYSQPPPGHHFVSHVSFAG